MKNTTAFVLAFVPPTQRELVAAVGAGELRRAIDELLEREDV